MESFGEVEGGVGRVEQASQRLVGFGMLARTDQAGPADELHATEQVVQAAATGRLPNVGRRGALQDGLGHRERRDVARVIGGIGERPGRPNPSAAIMAPAKRR